MQTSGGQRQARRGPDPRAGRGRGTRSSLAVALSMFVFAALSLVGLFGLVATVGVFAVYSQGLPAVSELERLQFIS
jgi:hypothetical protein